MRRLVRTVHLWVGLAAALFLISAGVSGSVLVFREEVDALLHPELVRVEPGGRRVGPDRVLDAVREAYPDDPPSYIRVPQAPERVYEVWTRGKEGPRVYIDPYRGTVLGAVAPTETLGGFLLRWHAELLSGRTGTLVVGGGAVLLLTLCVTGAVLWWPGYRRLQGLRVKWRSSWTRVNYDLHRAGGIVSLLFLVVISVTGVSLIFPALIQTTLLRLTASPAVPPPPHSTTRPGAERISLDVALRAANGALRGGQVTWIHLPQSPEATLAVRKRLPGEVQPNGRSFVYLDQYTAEPLLVQNAQEAAAGMRAYNVLYPLHTGAVGGVWLRILYSMLGLALGPLTVTGALIWWGRRRRPGVRPDAAPAPGRALQRREPGPGFATPSPPRPRSPDSH